jgi:hypothetical protein
MALQYRLFCIVGAVLAVVVSTTTAVVADTTKTVEKNGKGAYVSFGGTAPSKANPKGETHVGAGVFIRFGGGKKKKP